MHYNTRNGISSTCSHVCNICCTSSLPVGSWKIERFLNLLNVSDYNNDLHTSHISISRQDSTLSFAVALATHTTHNMSSDQVANYIIECSNTRHYTIQYAKFLIAQKHK